MLHPATRQFETQLKRLFDEVDRMLEQRHGHLFARHPARPAARQTAAAHQDGLFNVGSAFSAGYGSTLGRGYVIDLRIVTLESVPPEVNHAIVEEAVDKVRHLLPHYFPNRQLQVDRDGTTFKIHGDLGLGTV